MRRELTNKIRFVIDEYVPSVIRDSRWFMYPFYFIFLKGKIPRNFIDFKSVAYTLSDDEFEEMYTQLDSLGTDRPTDLNSKSMDFMFGKIDGSARALLDVGCGRGFFLEVAEEKGYEITGCDLLCDLERIEGKCVKCNAEELPFSNGSFDIVTCSHMLEHVRDLKKAVSELKRVAKKQIIVTVPCQKYYRYTVDLHLNFFPQKSILVHLMGLSDFICEKIGGDWVYVGWIK